MKSLTFCTLRIYSNTKCRQAFALTKKGRLWCSHCRSRQVWCEPGSHMQIQLVCKLRDSGGLEVEQEELVRG